MGAQLKGGGHRQPLSSFSPPPPHPRGLRFIQALLQSLCDGEQDKDNPNLIRVNATKAYELALRKYHGWMLQKLFLVSPRVGGGRQQRAGLPGEAGGTWGREATPLDTPFFKDFGGL